MLIALVNFIFSYVFRYVVQLIGVESFTKEVKILKNVFTLMSVFNSCLIILIISANFEMTDKAFNGEYSDFTPDWFRTNGKIVVYTVISAICFPVVGVMVPYIQLYMLKAND